MFFKKSNQDPKHVNNALYVTFVCWGIILIVNSLFEFINGNRLISNDFLILIIGLIAFFSTEFISKRFLK